MLLGIAGFEIRYQLRNPVFWVSIAIFFLLGFGITASENVSIGTPGAVHENAPYAIAVATAVFSVFYLFVVTAFVANAIVRDDSSGFAPIVRATSVTSTQILLGRFAGGLIVAWLGYLAIPAGMASGSIMPWVDPETIGPQLLFLLCMAVRDLRGAQYLPDLRAAVRARDHVALDDGRLCRRDRAGHGLSRRHRRAWPEDRISRHAGAVGAVRQLRLAGSDPLLDPERDEQPARGSLPARCCSTASGRSCSACWSSG